MATAAAYEMTPASVLPLTTSHFGVGEAAASWLVSGLFLGMALFAIPAGIVLDRTNDRNMFLLSAAVVLVLALAGWFAARVGALWWLVGIRFVSGAIIVGQWTAGINATSAIYSSNRQATGIGLFAMSVPAGIALAHLTSAHVAEALGWEWTLVVFPGLSFLAACGFLLSAIGMDFAGGHRSPSRRDFVEVLNSRKVWTVAGIAFIAFSLNLFFLNWLPTFLTDRLAVSLAIGGGFAALFPAVGVLGRGASGLVSDRLFDGRRRPVVLGSFVVILPFVLLIGLVRASIVLLLAIVVAGFVSQVGGALLYTYVRELVSANVVSTALAVLNMVGFLGAFSAPLLTGVLYELTRSHSIVFAYAGLLTVVGVALSWYAPSRD